MNKIIAIAIDEYSDPKIMNLSNCVRDLNSLIDVLTSKYQFDEVELYTKPQQTTLAFLYNELQNELINALEEDKILILFAGHGEFNSRLKKSYWLCSDSDKNNVTTWFNISDLLSFFDASEANHIALISDSCFSGAIFEISRGGGLDALQNKRSRQALTSGGIEKVLDGEIGKNSLFNVTLKKILHENKLESLSFNKLSENLILSFSLDTKQTPAYGALTSSGDNGGAYFFNLKKCEEEKAITVLQIPLDLNTDVKIESSFEIPFFNENEIFNSQFINAFVQQLGFSIINDIRVFIAQDESYAISRSNETEFYLEVSYVIETNNDKYLSLVINRQDFLGSFHPNHYIYTLNFAFNPDRKITLYDIIDYTGYKNLEDFLEIMIDRYADDEAKTMLYEYSKFEYFYNMEFSFNDDYFTIYYFNLFPHAFKALGFLAIPISEINFK